MSDDAWFELSQLLVDASPGIKGRLLSTLRGIGPEHAEKWIDRRRNKDVFDARDPAPERNQFIYSPTSVLHNHVHNRFYAGRPNSKLHIIFIDTEPEFELMVDALKVSLCVHQEACPVN